MGSKPFETLFRVFDVFTEFPQAYIGLSSGVSGEARSLETAGVNLPFDVALS